MARINLVRQDDFTGGLNLRADQFQLAPNESPDLLNVEIDPRGGVFSRGGWKEVGSATGTWTPKRLYPFYGSSAKLMMSTGAGVYYRDTANFTSLSLTPDATWGASFAGWGSLVYMALGHSTQAYKWNGSGAATALTANGTGAWQNDYTTPTGTHCPKAKLNITHAGKLWVANTNENSTAYPNRIRWSHENSPESWAELDFIEINDGSDGITGLASFGGQLIVYKTNSMYAIMGYNSDTFQVVELSRKVGAVSPMAVGVSERGAYCFSWPEGLHYYDGKALYDIFEPLRPMITLNNVNPAQTNKIFVNVINERVWLSVPYSTETAVTQPSCSFVYDPSIGRSGAYTKLSTKLAASTATETFGIAGGCGYVSSDGTSRGLALHPTRGVVVSVDNYDLPKDVELDLDQFSFDSYYRTRWIDGGMYVQKKMFRRPTIVAKQPDSATSLTIDVYHDFEEENRKRTFTLSLPAASTNLVWNTGQWRSASNSLLAASSWGQGSAGGFIKDSKGLGLCKCVQLKITGESGKEWGINSVTWKFSPRRVRG